MTYREGLLGPFQQFAVEVYNVMVNLPETFSDLQEMDIRNALYTCIIQAGIEKIELTTPGLLVDPLASFPMDRTRLYSGPEFGKAFVLVHEALRPYIPEGYENRPEFKSASNLIMFMIDLLHAFMRGKNMIYLISLPDPSSFGSGISPELIIPFRNLLSTMEPVYPEVVTPRVAVSKKNLSIFQEVIACDLYKKYVISQETLDSSTEQIDRALSAIKESSSILRSHNAKILKTKRIATSILPITSKLIETTFGVLPGKIAEISTNILTKWLSEDRRLVIYIFTEPIGYIFKRRYEEKKTK